MDVFLPEDVQKRNNTDYTPLLTIMYVDEVEGARIVTEILARKLNHITFFLSKRMLKCE